MFNNPFAPLKVEKDPQENASHSLNYIQSSSNHYYVTNVCEMCHNNCITNNNQLKWENAYFNKMARNS